MALSVDGKAPEVIAMEDDWRLIDDIESTKTMRAAGVRYLPKRPMERDEDYAARLDMATLLPAFTETRQRMVGRVFGEPLQVGEDVPGWIRDDVLPDVDRQGRNLHVFAREWFAEALAYGLSHCLVESPRVDGVRTKADQRALGARPYLIRVHPR